PTREPHPFFGPLAAGGRALPAGAARDDVRCAQRAQPTEPGNRRLERLGGGYDSAAPKHEPRPHAARPLVQTANGGGFGSLESLRIPESEHNTIVEVHNYDPGRFTHQQASWSSNRIYKDVHWTGT